MGIHLAGIVAAVSVFPASLTLLLRHKIPWPCTLALAHVSLVGFAVAVATTDQFAAHSTQLLAKVCAAERDNAYSVPDSLHLYSTADAPRTDSTLEPAAVVSISRKLENEVVDSAAGQH